jgi:hypothetical protein
MLIVRLRWSISGSRWRLTSIAGLSAIQPPMQPPQRILRLSLEIRSKFSLRTSTYSVYELAAVVEAIARIMAILEMRWFMFDIMFSLSSSNSRAER